MIKNLGDLTANNIDGNTTSIYAADIKLSSGAPGKRFFRMKASSGGAALESEVLELWVTDIVTEADLEITPQSGLISVDDYELVVLLNPASKVPPLKKTSLNQWTLLAEP